MKTSDKGVFAIAKHEGLCIAPYLDAARNPRWTYGVGHTFSAGPPNPATMPKGNPKNVEFAIEDSLEIFKKDLVKYEDEVKAAVTRKMTQAQFDAAVSFHFNTGAIGRASWVKSFNAGKTQQAIEQIMNWTKPESLTRRRKEEQKLFATGVYPGGQMPVYRVNQQNKPVMAAFSMTEEEVLKYMKSESSPIWAFFKKWFS